MKTCRYKTGLITEVFAESPQIALNGMIFIYFIVCVNAPSTEEHWRRL